MKVLWLPEARDDIKRLFETRLDADPARAVQTIRAIQVAAKRWREQARPGRRLDDDSGRREIAVAAGPGAYVVRGRVHNDIAVIVRVWHCREWHRAGGGQS